MIERISHSLQQSVCQVQRHGHNESQTHNNDDSFEQTSQDITHALAHLVACIHSLFRHSDNGKHKAQQNAQQSHCPIGISNGCVFKKDIDEIIRLLVIAHLDLSAHHAKEAVQNINDPAQTACKGIFQSWDHVFDNVHTLTSVSSSSGRSCVSLPNLQPLPGQP